MSPKYLRNRKTGRKFIYTELLAKAPDMEPVYDEAPVPPTAPTKATPTEVLEPAISAEQIGAATDNALASAPAEPVDEPADAAPAEPKPEPAPDALTLEAAVELINAISDKSELEAFALEHFDLDIDKRKGLDTLREQVIAAAMVRLAS